MLAQLAAELFDLLLQFADLLLHLAVLGVGLRAVALARFGARAVAAFGLLRLGAFAFAGFGAGAVAFALAALAVGGEVALDSVGLLLELVGQVVHAGGVQVAGGDADVLDAGLRRDLALALGLALAHSFSLAVTRAVALARAVRLTGPTDSPHLEVRLAVTADANIARVADHLDQAVDRFTTTSGVRPELQDVAVRMPGLAVVRAD